MAKDRQIWILVDYGNLSRIDSERGVHYLVSTILERLGGHSLSGADRASIRLYGGWYESDNLTRLAQDVLAQISSDFPCVLEVRGHKLKVTVELARSLIVSPDRDLLHTYRPRFFPGNVKCAEPPFENCMDVDGCPIASISNFVNNRKCGVDECRVRPKHILVRPEQKLVDSMIVADIISLALRGEVCAVVSSDDDVWPGVRTAVEFGGPIYHLHSKPGQVTPAHYTDGVAENYVQLAYPV